MYDPHGLSGKRVTGAGVEVKGKGHHVNPAELWDKQGFTSKEAQKVFDNSTVEAKDHNYKRHGRVTGYTAQVDAEFDQFKNGWMKNNQIKGGSVSSMSAKQQKSLAESFVKHLETGTKNEYIKGFNQAVEGGPNAVEKWYQSSGKRAFKPIQKTGTSFLTKAVRKIPYVKYALIPVAAASISSKLQAGETGAAIYEAAGYAPILGEAQIALEVGVAGAKAVDKAIHIQDRNGTSMWDMLTRPSNIHQWFTR